MDRPHRDGRIPRSTTTPGRYNPQSPDPGPETGQVPATGSWPDGSWPESPAGAWSPDPRTGQQRTYTGQHRAVRPGERIPGGATPQDREPRGRAPASRYRRRRVLVALALVLVLAAAAAVVVWTRTGAADDKTPAATTTTLQMPSPSPTTPTIAPIERDPNATAFAKALPSAFARFALTGLTATDQWAASGAGEAYTLTYADGTGPDATTITMTAGQWATDEEAITAKAAMLPTDVTPTATGKVTVGKDVVGDWEIIPGADGTATVTWRNSTAVITATGPAAEMEGIYRAYPM